MKKPLACLALLAAAGSSLAATSPPPCAADAIAQAGKLLAWHNGSGEQVAVEPQAKALAPIANPVNKAQKFSVLEVAGHIYKANYRMRLIYAAAGGQCLLMGQEILELSNP